MSNTFYFLYNNQNNPEYVAKELNDFLLFQFFSPSVLIQARRDWKTVPTYIQRGVPQEIQDLIFSNIAYESLEEKVNAFWVAKGIALLSSYQDCPAFFSDQKKNSLRINLLSPTGETILNELKEAQRANIYTSRTRRNAFVCGNKFYLPGMLFRSMSHLDVIPYEWRTYRYDEKKEEMREAITISLSKGCYNGCSHCGFSAQEDEVIHMPWPLFKQIYHTLLPQDPSETDYTGFFIYHDSDPISYRDPIAGIDVGDVVLYLNRMYGIEPAFMTKGISSKKQADALCKAAEGTFIGVSIIDLPGEKNVMHNFGRIKKTLDAFASVPVQRRRSQLIEANYFAYAGYEKGDISIFEPYIKSGILGKIRCITPAFVGRWEKTAALYGLNDNLRNNHTGFCEETYIIAANGMIQHVYRQEGQYIRKNIGSIFETVDETVYKDSFPKNTFSRPTNLKMYVDAYYQEKFALERK